MKVDWKSVAIVFIVLFVVETIIFFWVYFIGTEMLEKESECMDFCEEEEKCSSYYYDEYKEKCYLFDYDHELLAEKEDRLVINERVLDWSE